MGLSKDKLDNDDKIKEIDSDLEDIMDKLDDLNSESDA